MAYGADDWGSDDDWSSDDESIPKVTRNNNNTFLYGFIIGIVIGFTICKYIK